ncbi:MAG TPA: thioesterase family protein [Baekduia sp.]
MTAPATVTLRITLGAGDMDGLGHLNQARYHDLLGVARSRVLTEPFPDRGPGVPHGTFVVARTELDYLSEVRLADEWVEVHARIARVGTKSVTIENAIRRPDGVVAARGVTTMVAWDREARRSRTIGDAERVAYGAAVTAAAEASGPSAPS